MSNVKRLLRLIIKLIPLKLVSITFILLIVFSSIASAAIISGSIYDLSLQKESDSIIEINTLPKQLLVSKDGDYSFNVRPGSYTLYVYTTTSEASESVIVEDEGNYTLDIVLGEKSIYSNEDLSLDVKNLTVSLDIPSDSTNSSNSSNLRIVFGIVLGLLVIIILMIIGTYLFLYSKKYSFKNFKNFKKSTSSLNNNSVDSKLKQSKRLQSKNSKINKLKQSLDTSSNQSVNKSSNHSNNNSSYNNSLDEYGSLIFNIIKKEKRTTQKDIRSKVPLSEAKISLVISDLEDKGMIRKIKKGRGNILIFVKD